jgi:hypothetical protein
LIINNVIYCAREEVYKSISFIKFQSLPQEILLFVLARYKRPTEGSLNGKDVALGEFRETYFSGKVNGEKGASSHTRRLNCSCDGVKYRP